MGELETSLGCGTGLVQSTELRERGEANGSMRCRMISVGLDRPSTPSHCLLPAAQEVLRYADE